MNTDMERTRLSLFGIKSDLRGLVEQRCDALDRLTELRTASLTSGEHEVTLAPEIDETEAELATLDGLIRQYIGKELEKIDSTAHVILDLTARQQIHKAEADRLYMIAANEEATVKRIKELVLLVMDEFGEKKLRGAMHDLSSVGNGGVQALTIAQPDIIPDSFRTVTFRVPALLLKTILDTLPAIASMQMKEVERGFDSQLIRASLEHNNGVPGCRLEPRGKHLRVR